ncbi:Hpt domain-containing protein [Kordiimonas pumila]|uniref:HPt domain-containing protein n=1 Tax=Kordiimonas pumila TaxID=2161677 RepID=A0ABV7D112_9PROT|nr:hypothetical protein [Kordiimonas pumila]
MNTDIQSYADDDALATQFIDWSSEAVAEMRQLTDNLAAISQREDENVARVYELAHNIKGMGSSFNYMLLTTVGTSLCGYLKAQDKGLDRVNKRVIEAHVRAIEVILKNKIVGRGGEKGAAVERRLAEIILEDMPS